MVTLPFTIGRTQWLTIGNEGLRISHRLKRQKLNSKTYFGVISIPNQRPKSYREGTKTAGQKNSRNSRRPKFLIQPGANNFKTAGGQKPKKQPRAKRPTSNKTAGVEKYVFFVHKRRSVVSPLPCGRPRLWKIMFFCIYTFFFTLQNTKFSWFWASGVC